MEAAAPGPGGGEHLRLGALAERAEREARDQAWHVPTDETTSINPMFINEQRYDEALNRAQQMRSEQRGETLTLRRTFARDPDKANAFSKLSRYEIAIECPLYKVLYELERRRQAARHGGSVQPPQVMDVSGVTEGDR